MADAPSDAQLLAFLEETLPAAEIAALEIRLRNDQNLLERLAKLRSQEDAGVHSLGAIWRRFRLSCPSREELGQWLLGVLEPASGKYVDFHLEQIGCRYCQANVDDLRRQSADAENDVGKRRQRLFATSVGRLPRAFLSTGSREFNIVAFRSAKGSFCGAKADTLFAERKATLLLKH